MDGLVCPSEWSLAHVMTHLFPIQLEILVYTTLVVTLFLIIKCTIIFSLFSKFNLNILSHFTLSLSLWLSGHCYFNSNVSLLPATLSLPHLDDFWSLQQLIQYFFLIWPCHAAYGILIPWPGIKPKAPILKAYSLNHWTTREIPTHFS